MSHPALEYRLDVTLRVHSFTHDKLLQPGALRLEAVWKPRHIMLHQLALAARWHAYTCHDEEL